MKKAGFKYKLSSIVTVISLSCQVDNIDCHTPPNFLIASNAIAYYVNTVRGNHIGLTR